MQEVVLKPSTHRHVGLAVLFALPVAIAVFALRASRGVDVRTNRRTATIPLGGNAGNTQYDPASRHVFMNDQTHGRLIELEPAADRVLDGRPMLRIMSAQ